MIGGRLLFMQPEDRSGHDQKTSINAMTVGVLGSGRLRPCRLQHHS